MTTKVSDNDILNLHNSGKFDEQWYLSQYPDVAMSGMDPAKHYLWVGIRLKRYSSEGVKYLLNSDPDLDANEAQALTSAASDVPAAPLIVKSETSERRIKGKKNSVDARVYSVLEKEFDREFYLTTYPDVAAAQVDPIEHYILAGWKERRDPALGFSTRYYLDNNADIVEAGINPFYHFLQAGRSEGREGRHRLGFRYDILSKLKSVADQIGEMKQHRAPVPLTAPSTLEARLAEVKARGERIALSFSHDDFSIHVGGIQLLLRRELELLRKEHITQIHIFPAHPLPFVEVSPDPVVLGVLINGEHAGFYRAPDVASAAAIIGAGAWNETKFVVHNLLGHNIDQTIALIDAFNADRGYFWIHDYAALHNNYKLLRNDVEYSGVPKPGTLAYDLCEFARADFSHPKEFNKLFSKYPVEVISPSLAALEIWLEAGYHEAANLHLLHHCALLPAPRGEDQTAPVRPLRVGFLGYPVDHKGWSVFRDLSIKFADDPRYQFFHLGSGRRGGVPVTFHHAMSDKQTPDAMLRAVEAAELDIALIWAIWPETFCLTAYEALAGGAALVSNPAAGNVAWLIEDMAAGLVCSSESELTNQFESGAILSLARANRERRKFSLQYSELTVGFLRKV